MPTRATAIVSDAGNADLHVDGRGASAWRSNSWPTWLIAAVLSGIAAFPLQESLTRFPRGLLADDAYFYVKIAWNLGMHHSSTFDGIHVTDGYHFAWQMVLAGVSFVVGRFFADPGVHLGAMLWVYFMLCWAIGIFFGRSRADALLLFSMGLVFKALMETTLLALVLLALYANVYLSPPRQGTDTGAGGWAWRPWLLVLMPLIRIDAVLIGGLMALSRLFPATHGDVSRHTSKLNAVAADMAWLGAGVVLQLAWRLWVFGEWTSVSMQIKSSPGSWDIRLQNNLIGLYGSNLASTAIFLFLFALAIQVAATRARNRARDLVALSAPAAFVIFHLATNNQIVYWYFLPAACVHVWYFLQFGPPAARRTGWMRRAAIAMLPALVVAKWAVDSRIRGPQIEWSRQFVRELQRAVPEDEPVFQIDASGWIGWFSGRRVVNGDGLVNDHAYARRLQDNRLDGYLHDEDIRYIIETQYPRDGVLIDMAGLRVPMESVDVVIPPPANFPDRTAFGLYRLK
jgi:hypothetical protein